MNSILEQIVNMTPEEMLGALVVGSVLVGMAARRLRRKRKPPPLLDPLDYPLFDWEPGDPFTVRHLLAGGVSILGRTSSGKTSGFGRHLMRAIVRHPLSSGLICAPKPEDVDDARKIFQAVGRIDDLLVINPDGELRCNVIDYIRRLGGDTREVTKCITTIGETLRSSDTKGGGEDGDFWDREYGRMIFNAVEVVQLATGTVSGPNLQQFIMTALQSPQEIDSPRWKGGFHDECLRAACNAQKSERQKHDFLLAFDYWFKEYPRMADRTRSSILTGVMGTLHVFNTGIVREICSTTTNVSPDDMLKGKWVLVNMPPSKHGEAGTFVNTAWKLIVQRMVLARKAQPHQPFVTIWTDEYQGLCNSMDAHYLAQCRSHMGCMVILTQSLHSIFGAMKGKTGEHQAAALLTNFHHKVFHALGDSATAQYASSLLGQYERTKISGQLAPPEDAWDELFGTPKVSTSFSDQWEPILQPAVFQNGLRTGGPENGFLTDAIAIKSGEPFRNGQNWRYVTINQRG